MNRSDWMTTEETTQYLGIGKSKLYDLAQTGEVPRHKVGKAWKFHRNDLDAWVRASRSIEDFFTTVEYVVDDNIELRDPQREAHAAILEHFGASGEDAILQLPVGCGKSGLIAILPFGLAHGRVLVISPNITIRDSLYADLNITDRRRCFWRKRSVLSPETMLAGPHVAVLDGRDANIHDCEKSHIVLTNIQQLASSADRWLPNFEDSFFDLILVDEGHHSAANSWEKVFDRFPDAKVVKLTATPYRADDREITGKLVYRYSFKRAMVKGYIKRLQAVYVAPSELTFTYEGDTKTHTLREVLQLKEEDWFSRGVALSSACNVDIVTASLDRLEQLRQTGTRHQIVAVAMQIDHARAIRSLYAERGYEAETIHSKMAPEDRVEVLRKLKAGLIDVIVQVQMLGEGFDHPQLSVAAIFRPFRSLAPYLQFVGRAMRVVVQNDPRHPDNYGYIVTHSGMNLDTLLTDFREIEREDHQFLEGLIKGDEPEPPREVTEGRTQMKIRPDMVVHNEVLDSLIEEDFLDADDEMIFDELRRNAEAMGLDADAVVTAAKESKRASTRTVRAPEPYPVSPQRERQEAQKRLNERIKTTARVLLNRIGTTPGGSDLSRNLLTNMRGTNFVVAIQLFNGRVKSLVSADRRGDWSTDELKKAMDLLPEILNAEVRRLKVKQRENAENRKARTRKGTQ
ncbi:MAG: DEAD/DEAH box helicase family protein [Chloroflexi bacterium]|nr:DEAD/DEAH box helicase family protein [Chloroflexota bacterium]